MNAYLTHPESGTLNVPADAELMLCFEGTESEEEVHIQVGGEWAIRGGQETRQYATTRTLTDHGNLRIGVRRRTGLDPGAHLIEGWTEEGHATVDERIYVRGTQTKIPIPPGDVTRIPGGFFAVQQGQWSICGTHHDVPDYLSGGCAAWSGRRCIAVYPQHNRVVTQEDSYPVPGKAFDHVQDWAITDTEASWVLITVTTGGVFVVRPESLHWWAVTPEHVAADSRFIHLDMGAQTAHLPTTYDPSSVEQTMASWYTIDNPGDGRNRFGDGLHVWWSSDQMLAKHDPTPFRGGYDGILWESDDIDDTFEDVEIIDDRRVIVNDAYLLNTRYPDLQTL